MSKPPPSNPYAEMSESAVPMEATGSQSRGTQNGLAASLGPLPLGAMNAPSTAEGLQSAIKYIDMFFKARGVTERFSTLKDEDVENEHLGYLFDNLFHWFSTTPFRVNTPSGFMAPSGKETKYKQMKSAFQKRFPDHPLFKNDSYWSTMTSQFQKKCKNTRMTDTDIANERRSIPLYRTINDTLIRQKYRGDRTKLVDAVDVSFSFIVNGSEGSCHKLAEQNLSRNAIGRGGEHLFLRYQETCWDDLFRAADFDWQVIKQSETKCSLHFCDYDQPYLCSFFGLGAYYLTGGLRRVGLGVGEGVADYVFPLLHKIGQKRVASNLSDSISRHLKVKFGKEKANQITTRSSRKGAMTENRANPELDRSHEYARSGHSGPEFNPNAEGYIQTTPAMSAPGGRALCGYPDPHAECVPISFEVIKTPIGIASVERLITELFVNDVPLLQKGGKLYDITLTCAARLVGSYNKLYKDIQNAHRENYGDGPDNNQILIRIRGAAERAHIDDPTINEVANIPRWLTVLRVWSSRITDHFKANNPDCVGRNASLTQQFVGVQNQLVDVKGLVEGLAGRFDGRTEDRTTIDSLQEVNRDKDARIARLESENESKDREIARLKRKLASREDAMKALMAQSPSPPSKKQRNENGTGDVAAQPGSPSMSPVSLSNGFDIDADLSDNPDGSSLSPPALPAGEAEVAAASTQMASSETETAAAPAQMDSSASEVAEASSTRVAAAAKAPLKLSGVQQTKTSTKGVTITSELERLWQTLVEKRKSAEAKDLEFTKRVLFEKNNPFWIGHSAQFNRKDHAKYRDAMKLVAIATSNEQWDQLTGGEIDNKTMRRIVGAIKNEALATLVHLHELHNLRKDPTKKCKFTQKMRGFGDNARTAFNAVAKGLPDLRQEEWLRNKLGERAQPGDQQSLHASLSNE